MTTPPKSPLIDTPEDDRPIGVIIEQLFEAAVRKKDEEITTLRVALIHANEDLAVVTKDRDTWKRVAYDAHSRMIQARQALATGDDQPTPTPATPS